MATLAIREKHFNLTHCDWQRYLVLVSENESGTCVADLQMSNIAPQKVSSNQSRGDERVCYSASQMIFDQVESEYIDSYHLNTTFTIHKVRQLVLFFHVSWLQDEVFKGFFFLQSSAGLWPLCAFVLFFFSSYL